MGWSIRKSFKFGGARINLSNSGISGSFGVKGARVSTGKRGTHINLGTSGIYYRQRISRRRSIPLLILLGVIISIVVMFIILVNLTRP